MRRRRKAGNRVVASIRDRLGRTIVVHQKTMDKLAKHVDRDLDGAELAIMRAVENADKRRAGNRPNTEVIFARNIGRAKWLAVVVEYDQGLGGKVITAYPLTKDPNANE